MDFDGRRGFDSWVGLPRGDEEVGDEEDEEAGDAALSDLFDLSNSGGKHLNAYSVANP